jgi:hypothetical protein
VLYLALNAFTCRAELSALNGHRQAERNIQLKKFHLAVVKNFHANESAWEKIFLLTFVEFLLSFSALSRFGRKSKTAFLI